MAENAKDGVKGGPEGNTPVPGEEKEDEIDVAALVQTLRGGKRTIIRATAAGFAVATILAFMLPPRYTSSTSFVPPGLNGGSSMASALAGQLSALGGGELLGGIKNPGDLYVGMLKSRSIKEELVKRFDLIRVYRVAKESQAEKILDSNTEIVVDPKSSIVTVNATASTPELAQQLAGAYMDALRETNGRLALGQSSQRRLFFGQQLAKEKDDLEDAEVELKKTEEQSGLIAPTGQTESEISTIAQTQAQIAVRQVQLAALRNGATEGNPEVIRLRSEIDDLQGQLARLQNGNGKSTATIPTSKVPAVELEYVRKEREVKYHEALFDMLSRQYEAARLDESRDAPVLQVLDDPSYPDSKSGPRRLYIMLGGLVAGFFASCVWVLLRDYAHTFLSSAAAVSSE
ncbi:MAG TPA: Wzz/FepE/Etk N-terminal domain-containing protein [Acidobacteriaceae bacterium]|nr:Wzz/FepE/Etk N-terminal domain-containing protein [Acidobacteriaceae bacterium]